MDKNTISRIQDRVRDQRYGLGIYYYIDSPVLRDLHMEYGNTLENVFEDEYDDVNEVYDIELTSQGVLTFVQHNLVGYSYDTPSFGYTENTTLEYLLHDLDNYVGGNLSNRLNKDNINELIIVGCVGDQGTYADDSDVVFIDYYYSPYTGFQNRTQFVRFLQYDNSRIEFNGDYDISCITYSTEFEENEGTLTLQGLELVEVIDSWIQDDQRILKIDTLEIPSTLILSLGTLFSSYTFYVAPHAIRASSKLKAVYIDHNIVLEENAVEIQGNNNTLFYIAKSNTDSIAYVQRLGFEVILIEEGEIPTYEGELEE